MNKPLVIIPAFNEETVILNVIGDLKSNGYDDILVVNDASTDNTLAMLPNDIKVASLPYNLGAWKATQTGIRYAYQCGYEQIITFDADGQHLAKTLNKLLAEHDKKQFDLVIGACLSRGSIARKIAWHVFRKISGVQVRDLTSGLRVYNRKAMKVLSGKAASLLEYQDVGVLLLLKNNAISKVELDVDMQLRKNGISRIFNSWGAVLYYMAYTTTLCLSKLFKAKKLEEE